jgi:hypothetical protein
LDRAKLTDADVAEIRRVGAPWARSGRWHHRRGTATLLRQIAKQFGVSTSNIMEILK